MRLAPSILPFSEADYPAQCSGFHPIAEGLTAKTKVSEEILPQDLSTDTCLSSHLLAALNYKYIHSPSWCGSMGPQKAERKRQPHINASLPLLLLPFCSL